MPKFTPNAIIKDCWSPIGNITFYHRGGQCFWKRKARPVFRGTPAQLDQQQVHLRAISAWHRDTILLCHSLLITSAGLSRQARSSWIMRVMAVTANTISRAMI